MHLLSRTLAWLVVGVLLLCPLVVTGLGLSNAEAKEQRNLRVGASYVFELGGNPSTGYKWRLNQGASENLAIVTVEDLGYSAAKTSGKKLVGAPAPYRFRITGLAPGSARLHFEYVRPWVGKPLKAEDLTVRVSD
jgi:inhibitor of cysteine peptidase